MTQYLTSMIACPLCKDIIKSFSRLTEGYFWSIVLMLTIPFLLVGFFGGFLARAYLKNTALHRSMERETNSEITP